MDNLILGIDLSDRGTSLVYYSYEQSWHFPTVICHKKSSDEWLVGKEGYEAALDGDGVITDKLYTLAVRDKIATVCGTRYEGIDILKEYFKLVIDTSVKELGRGYPEQIVITIPKIEPYNVEKIKGCINELGYSKQMIHIISRAESFIYYVMGQQRDIWNNQVGMFCLEDHLLTYYELKTIRQLNNITVLAEEDDLEDAFDLEIIETPSGAKLADKILCSCADRLLKKKLFSSVFLTGDGFKSVDWADNFMKLVCAKRRTFADTELFARGAANKGFDKAAAKKVFKFRCICDGRLETSVYIRAKKSGQDIEYPLAMAGDRWDSSSQSLRMIYDGTGDMDIIVEALDKKRRKQIKLPLDFLPKRPPKTTAIGIDIEFEGSRLLKLKIKDMGFGEIYKASDTSICQEVKLWD